MVRFACALLIAVLFSPIALAAGVFERKIERVEGDVWMTYRPDVLRQPVDGNTVFIVGAQEVIVVDAGGGPVSANESIRLLRTVTDKPVRRLINTHWHGDHTLGNARWAEVYPGLEIIAHARTREAMSGRAMNYVQDYVRDLPGFAEQLEKSVATGKRSDGTALTPAQIEHNRTFAADIRAYVASLVATKILPPTRTITDKLTLDLDGQAIEVSFPGEGHTDGDLVVWLPVQRILIGGDLVGSPIPFGTASYPKHWASDLDRIASLQPRLIVPGHGPVQHDLTYVGQLRALLLRIADQARAAADAKMPFEAFEKGLDLGATAAPFKGDDNQDFMFRETFLKPIARGAYNEATGKPIVQGALGKS